MMSTVFLFAGLFLASISGNEGRAPLLVISFDGVQAGKFDQWLQSNPNSNLKKFINEGSRSEFMVPSFPTKTWPNHMTIVTGLYPESHGIIGNIIYDPVYDAVVNFLNGNYFDDPKMWNMSEPVWMTAKRQNLTTAAFNWIGSYVIGRTPDIWMPYAKSYDFFYRVDTLVTWLEKIKVDLTFFYLEQPDSTGHSFGSESVEYLNTITQMDEMFGYLVSKLKKASLYDKMNILIVSDHGMAQLYANQTILIGDYVKNYEQLIYTNDSILDAFSIIYPKNMSYVDDIVNQLSQAPNLKVYRHDEIPAEYHFQKSYRIGPILAVAEEGYSLGYPSAFQMNGTHGWNSTLKSMRTIFLARGVNIKPNTTIASFNNVDVYSLICQLSQISCLPNNGTLSTFKSIMVSTDSTGGSVALKPMLFSVQAWAIVILMITKPFL